MIAMVLDNLGGELLYHREYAEARPLLEEALQMARELDDVLQQSSVRSSLALMAEMLGDRTRALTESQAALLLAWQIRSTYFVLQCLDGVAIALRHSSPGQAARLLSTSDSARALLGSPVPSELRDGYDHGLAEMRAALGAAAFVAAWEAGRLLSLDEAVGEALALADELAGDGAGTTD